MKLTRAPVLAALGLLLAFAGQAHAYTYSGGTLSVLHPAALGDQLAGAPIWNDGAGVYENVHLDSLGDSWGALGTSVGPYTLTVKPNPLTDPLFPAAGAVQLPCIAADLHVFVDEYWEADIAKASAIAAGEQIDVPGTGQPGNTVLNQANVWQVAYLATNYMGTWTSGTTGGSFTWTTAQRSEWDEVHAAIWTLTGHDYSTYSVTGDADPHNTAWYLSDALGHYNARGSAKVAEDLDSVRLLLPTATASVPQPFIVPLKQTGDKNIPVPEPATWALVALGAALVGKRRRAAA